MRSAGDAFFATAPLWLRQAARRHYGRKRMISCRVFMSMTAATLAGPKLAAAQSPAPGPAAGSASGKVALYANVGADLTHYDVDVAGMSLTPRETVTLPASVQYAWPHASRRYL